MSAYVIVDIDVKDPEGYQEYARLAPAAVTLYGGRYLRTADRMKHWKATGTPSDWSSWNSRTWAKPKRG